MTLICFPCIFVTIHLDNFKREMLLTLNTLKCAIYHVRKVQDKTFIHVKTDGSPSKKVSSVHRELLCP